MKKKTRIGLNVGSSSVLLVFVLLCMVTFAALSFVSANADYTLSKSLADRTTAYYTTSNKAEQQLSVIQQKLTALHAASGSESDYKKRLSTLFNGDSGIQYMTDKDGDTCGILTWRTDFTDSQALESTLTLYDPFSSEQIYTVSQWQIIQTKDWENNSTMNLYDGE